MSQAAPDIKKKHKTLDRIGEEIRACIMVAERVFNTIESAEEKELKNKKKIRKKPHSNVRSQAEMPPPGVGQDFGHIKRWFMPGNMTSSF